MLKDRSSPPFAGGPRRQRSFLLTAGTSHGGQTLVEFALASVVFLLMVFGTIDFGRAIYINSLLNEGVQSGARAGKRMAMSAQTTGCGAGCAFSKAEIASRVTNAYDNESGSEVKTPRPGLSSTTVTVTCSNGSVNDCPSGARLTVTGTLPFQAVTQDFLQIPPFTLSASSSVIVE